MRRYLAPFLSLWLLMGCNAEGEPTKDFEVKTDTIYLTLGNYIKPASRVSLTHAVKHNGKYYCFFRESGLYYFSNSRRHFFIISQDGCIEDTINLPGSIENSTYFDLFVRNDSILTKAYMREGTHYLDIQNKEWVEIEDVDDVIYEDPDYYVTFLDFGEWGHTTWFKDKQTENEYELYSASAIINKWEGSYYLTSPFRISRIDDPTTLKPCWPNRFYQTVKSNHRIYESSYSTEGADIIYGDTLSRYHWDDSDSLAITIITSFIHNERLFHLCMDSTSTFVAQLHGREMVPVKHVGEPLSVFNWYYSYRHKIQGDNSQLLKFKTEDPNTYGFIELKEDNIDIRFLNHDVDSVKYIGTDGFAQIFDLCTHIDSLPLSDALSLENHIGGTDLKLFTEGALHKSYYPNDNNLDFEGGVKFLHIQDSLMANTSKYYYTTDSLVKVVFLEWTETQPYHESDGRTMFFEENPAVKHRFQQKLAELEAIIADRYGSPTGKKTQPYKNEQYWDCDNGIKITMHYNDFNRSGQIRMVIYKE